MDMSNRHGHMAPVRIVAFALLVLALAAPATALAQTSSPNDPSSAELVETPKTFDGTTITYTGEVIGEAMVRGDMAWLHINDDPYYLKNVEEGAELGGYNSGHAFWIPADLTEEITYYGDYKHEGDVVTVRGTFNAACAEHGGDMDIHATELTVDVPGHEVVDEVSPGKIAWAVGLPLLAFVLWLGAKRTTLSLERGLVHNGRGRR